MKRLLVFLAFALCLISCGKKEVNDIVARYRFDAVDSKAISQEYLEFEPGDEIAINLAVYDEELLKKTPDIGSFKAEYEYNGTLIYDGTSWCFEDSGAREIEVKGPKGAIVYLRYKLNKFPEFVLGATKRFPLSSGSQTIILDFEDLQL